MSPVNDLRAHFFANLRAHVVARGVQAILGLVLVPYVLAHLSREEYGLWSWLLALSSWLTLADFGLSTGNVNPLARSLAAKDERRIGEMLAAALGLHAFIAVALLLLAFVGRDVLLAALPAVERELGFRTLTLLIAAQGLVVVSFPFGSLLSALQRLDLVHRVQTSQLVLQALGTIAILENGGRVLALAWLQLGLALFQLGVRIVLSRRQHPTLRLAWPPREDVPALVSTGLPVVLLGLVGSIALNFERTYLGFVIDLALVAQYAVAMRLVMAVREAPQVLLSAVVPASAALDVAGDEAALERLYVRSFKVAVSTVLPLAAVLAVSAPALLRAWLGPGFEAAARIAAPLAIAILVPLVTAPGVQILIGRGRLGRVAPVYVVWGAAFIVGNVLWLSLTGFAGAGWGALVVNVSGAAALLRRMHGTVGLAPHGVADLLRKAVIVAAAAGLAGELVVMLGHDVFGLGSRSAALAIAASGAAAVAVTHLALARVSGLLEAEDWRVFTDALGFRVR